MQLEDIDARSKKCTAAGKPEITIEPYQARATRPTRSSRARTTPCWPTRRSCAYAVKQTNGQLELVGDIYDSAPYGYVVAKDQQDFAEAIAGRVQGADRGRHVQEDPRQVGRAGRRRSAIRAGQPAS